MHNPYYEEYLHLYSEYEKSHSYWGLLQLAAELKLELVAAQEELRRLQGHTPVDMPYAGAILAMQRGALVSRRSWGESRTRPHVRLIQGEDYILLPSYGTAGVLLPDPQEHHPWFAQSYPTGRYGPWTPTTEDQLATDWYLTTKS